MGESSKRRTASARTASSAPMVPRRLMAKALRVGVRSLSSGWASKPRWAWVGPNRAATASRSAGRWSSSAMRLLRTQGRRDRHPGHRVGLESEAGRQQQELPHARMPGQRRGPGVRNELRPLDCGQLGQVLGQGQAVCGLVADAEDAPAARVDHGQSLARLGQGGGIVVEDEVAGRSARPARRPEGPARQPAPSMSSRSTRWCRRARAPVRRAAGAGRRPRRESSGCPPWRMKVFITSRTGAPLASSRASHRSVVTVLPYACAFR